MRRPSFKERARYAFDNTMAKGTPALIAWLAVATVAMLVVYVLVLFLVGANDEAVEGGSPVKLFWFGLMRAMDAGAVGGDQGSWPFLLTGLAVSVGGIFLVSALIGVLNSGLEARLDELRKGRSTVIEDQHTLVLGWSASIFTILDELVLANENKKRACIVILADRDKVEMEDAIRERMSDTKTTRIVCRSGPPSDSASLDMVNVQGTKSILVLSPEQDDADVEVIKTILAITNGPSRRQSPYHIVAELQSPRNVGVAKMVGKDEVEVILAGELISRITVQTCRQSGLSVVHTELLDFGGDEIYFADALKLVGRTFGDVLSAYDTSSVIGLVDKDGVHVLPSMDRILEPEDRLIAISRDDDTIVLSSEKPVVDPSAIVEKEREPARPERTLILGWNWRAPWVIEGLDAYVAQGSFVQVVAEGDRTDECAPFREKLRNQTLEVREGDTTDRDLLESLDVASFDHIILLCSDELEAQRADARVLVTLLHLREMGERLDRDFAIVSEMRDVRNRELAEVTQADDFIVSDKLVSLMMCQVSENKQLHAVLADLFDPDGAEIYLKPALDYVRPGVPVTFHTVVESAKRRGEIAIGYRLAAHEKDASKAYGVAVNPDKRGTVTFGPADKVVVVAES
ncbi:MAG: NAD-binding protein [Polyangiales bacterium]